MMYGYRCEYCEGTVRERVVKSEAFRHKTGFVILEDVPIGICDRCGHHYYAAAILHTVEEIASGRTAPKRTLMVPVDDASPSRCR